MHFQGQCIVAATHRQQQEDCSHYRSQSTVISDEQPHRLIWFYLHWVRGHSTPPHPHAIPTHAASAITPGHQPPTGDSQCHKSNQQTGHNTFTKDCRRTVGACRPSNTHAQLTLNNASIQGDCMQKEVGGVFNPGGGGGYSPLALDLGCLLPKPQPSMICSHSVQQVLTGLGGACCCTLYLIPTPRGLLPARTRPQGEQ